MSSEWIGVLHDTAPKYIKGAVDLTMRRRLALKMLQSRGRVTFNNDGYNHIWTVRFDENQPESYADGGALNFTRSDLYRQAELDVRSYVETDSMTEKERLMNRGDVAIVRRYERILPVMRDSLANYFGKQLYLDGYAAGNENSLVGYESFCGSANLGATNSIANPSDTYATRSTAVGASGSWEAVGTAPNATIATDWPNNTGDAKYDYWSPKLVNWAATTWTGSTSWEDNCERVLRQTTSWLADTAGADMNPVMGIMNSSLFTGLKNRMAALRQIIVPSKEAEDMGFGDTMKLDGVTYYSEYGIPSNTAYIMPINKVSLMSWNSELFSSEGPTYDINTNSYKFLLSFTGNMKFESPKFFGKVASLSS